MTPLLAVYLIVSLVTFYFSFGQVAYLVGPLGPPRKQFEFGEGFWFGGILALVWPVFWAIMGYQYLINRGRNPSFLHVPKAARPILEERRRKEIEERTAELEREAGIS